MVESVVQQKGETTPTQAEAASQQQQLPREESKGEASSQASSGTG